MTVIADSLPVDRRRKGDTFHRVFCVIGLIALSRLISPDMIDAVNREPSCSAVPHCREAPPHIISDRTLSMRVNA